MAGIPNYKSNLYKEEKSEIDKIKINDSVTVLGTDRISAPLFLPQTG